jgi:4-amino-4-deoxy-L-arabinose transferase-like glycosyltransferase
MRRDSLPRLSLHRAILLYAAGYFLITLGIHCAFFPIGDIGVESDFFGDLVVAAEKLVQHDFSVASYPYKGPFYSFALVLIHLVCGDWYLSGVVLNAICAAASLIVILHLFEKIYGGTIALLTTLAVSLGIEYFTLALKASSDMLFLFLCYCAINVLFMDAFSWRRVIAGGILGACAFLTRYTGVFLPVALIAMLLINPWRWSRRRRLAAASVYLAVFLAVCAPWFIKSAREAGTMLPMRNIENVIREFYGGGKAKDIPAGGFASIMQVFIHDPAYFAGHYLLNIPMRFWRDMTRLLGIEVGILVSIGIIRLFFRPPTRRQWAFLVFPASFFLVICTVFYVPRFSLPLTPAYYAIAFSMLIALQGMKRAAVSERSSQTGKRAWRVTPARALTICIVAALFFVHIVWIVQGEKYYYRERPMYILDAARFLKARAAEQRRPAKEIVMARKPHIAYFSNLSYRPYPLTFTSLLDIVSAARNSHVSYIVFSDIERAYFGNSKVWRNLGMIEGIKTIYSTPSITIYELAY